MQSAIDEKHAANCKQVISDYARNADDKALASRNDEIPVATVIFSEFSLGIKFFHSEMCEQKCCFSGVNWTNNNTILLLSFCNRLLLLLLFCFWVYFSLFMHQIKLRIQSIDLWISFVCLIKLFFLNHSNWFIHAPQNLFRNRRHLMGWAGIRGWSTHNWQHKSNEIENNNNNNDNNKNKTKTTQTKNECRCSTKRITDTKTYENAEKW